MRPKRRLPKLIKQIGRSAGFSVLGLVLSLSSAKAQIVPDNSAGTQVDASGIISGGTQTSTGPQNLFHSFQQFSLSATDTATFVTAPTVANVISRITGQTPSNIDGTIRLLGSTDANFFLLNPAGIVFGPNAQLQVPGSFVATTAENLSFADGSLFSTQNLSAPPLTVSVPVGLQMGAVSQSIAVNGTGHTLTRIDPTTGERGVIAPHVQLGASRGLQVLPGRTLALVGQGIDIEGGLITAHSGNLLIGSVAPNEQVGLSVAPGGFSLNYASAENLADITFSNRALANVSGVAMPVAVGSPLQVFVSEQGTMQMVGRDITLAEGSLLLGQSGPFSTRAGLPINVTAAGKLSLLGSRADTSVRSGIVSETLGNMASGDINIAANDLQLDGGAGITSLTFTDASSGVINVDVANALSVVGNNAIDPILSSTIATASIVSAGESGDIDVSAGDISILDSGSIASVNFAQGSSGNVTIASDTLTLRGRNLESNVPSNIAVTNYGPGSVGDVEVNTRQLSISETSAISSQSVTSGDAGSIVINATERIDIVGPENIGRRGESITASVNIPSIQEQAFLGIPPARPSSNAGDILINTPLLNLSGGFGITAQNEGTGDAGNVQIVADTFRLNDGGEVRGETFSGAGGNINLQIQNALLLNEGSRLTVESDGSGNGGNIMISAPVIITRNNSDIVASAVQGQGGNINITTQNLLGAAYRDQLTDKSDISASSQFGIDGTVAISSPNVDPGASVVALSADTFDSDETVAASCSGGQQNHFVASGRGGVATDPRDRIQTSHLWQDIRPLPPLATALSGRQPSLYAANEGGEVQEASAWQTNTQGQIELTATASAHMETYVAQCLK